MEEQKSYSTAKSEIFRTGINAYLHLLIGKFRYYRTYLDHEYHLTFLGLIAMMDPPRPESKEAVTTCIKAGIRPVMITGDHILTASAIAKRIGILTPDTKACEGAALDTMSDKELQDWFRKYPFTPVFQPEHKIRIVRAWQTRGHIVAMTGDGVNDAPVIKIRQISV